MMSENRSTDKVPTKVDEAYARICESIESGELGPGQKLTEAEAARLTGLSRGTVREALVRLEADGLINRPGAGFIRKVLDAEDIPLEQIVEHCETREAIEGKAAWLAAMNMSGRQIARLRELAGQLDAMLHDPNPDMAEKRKRHTEFHDYLLANCGNGLLHRIWSEILYAPIGARSAELLDRVARRHPPTERQVYFVELVDLIARHDSAGARSVMEQHIVNATERWRQMLDDEREARGKAYRRPGAIKGRRVDAQA